MGMHTNKPGFSWPPVLTKLPWPWIVLFGALTLTLFGWHWSSRLVLENASLRFDNQVEDVRLTLQSRLNSYEQVLHGATALFAASRGVTRNEWHEYVASLQLNHFMPGITGLGYAPYLRANQKSRFEQQIRAEGFPDFAIWPKGNRARYVPVEDIEPFAGANLRAFGFDMYSEPARRAAMDQARDTGKTAMTRQVQLMQDGVQTSERDFLLYTPIYDSRLPTATSTERRVAIRGFVFIPFRMADLVNQSLGRKTQGTTLRIYEEARQGPAKLLYGNSGSQQKLLPGHIPLFTRSLPLEFGGRIWVLSFQSQPAFYAKLDRLTPMLALYGGLFLSFLLFLITWSLTQTRKHAQSLAMRMTQELRISEARFRATFDQAAVGMTQSSPEGSLLQVNQRFCSMLGYGDHELLYRNVLDLSPPEDRERHQRAREAVLRGSTSSFVIEKRFICNDGQLIWGRLTGSLVRHPDGQAHYFIGVVEDITASKEAAQALQESYENLKQMNQELESFSYSVSHDLSTPLRAIEGFALILHEDYRNRLDAEGLSHLHRIRMASQRMAGLIDALLSLTRVSRKQLMRRDVDLSAMARQVAQMLKSTEPERQVDFVIEAGMRASCDAYMLESVLENLLGNAWKFTRPRSLAIIEFGTQELEGELAFYVKDNGVGFEMAYVDKLFGAFQRLHKAEEFKGFGIGLATTQRIIQRHGGRVWAEGAPGVGATFYFTINGASCTNIPEQNIASL